MLFSWLPEFFLLFVWELELATVGVELAAVGVELAAIDTELAVVDGGTFSR